MALFAWPRNSRAGKVVASRNDFRHHRRCESLHRSERELLRRIVKAVVWLYGLSYRESHRFQRIKLKSCTVSYSTTAKLSTPQSVRFPLAKSVCSLGGASLRRFASTTACSINGSGTGIACCATPPEPWSPFRI